MPTHVLATFTRRPQADEARDRVNQRYPWAQAHLGDTDDMLDAMALGQRAEIDEGVIGPSGLLSGPLVRGALVWGGLGLVVGAVLGLGIGVVVSAEGAALGAWVVFCALAGALAVGTVMAVLGGARQAVKEGETTAEDPTAVVRIDLDAEPTAEAEHADELVAVLAAAGARRVDVVDAPVPRPATADVEAPRPRRDDRLARQDRATTDAGFEPDPPV